MPCGAVRPPVILGTTTSLNPTVPYIYPGDPAIIHPFLADLGKERSRRSQDSSSSNTDLGALALHLAIRCASSAFLSRYSCKRFANPLLWRMKHRRNRSTAPISPLYISQFNSPARVGNNRTAPCCVAGQRRDCHPVTGPARNR